MARCPFCKRVVLTAGTAAPKACSACEAAVKPDIRARTATLNAHWSTFQKAADKTAALHHLQSAIQEARQLVRYQDATRGAIVPSPKLVLDLLLRTREQCGGVSPAVSAPARADLKPRARPAVAVPERAQEFAGPTVIALGAPQGAESPRAGQHRAPTEADRRSLRRQGPTGFHAKIVGIDEAVAVRDVSPKGISLRSGTSMRAGAQWHVVLEKGEKRVEAVGVVRWTRPCEHSGLTDVGLQFLRVSRSAAEPA